MSLLNRVLTETSQNHSECAQQDELANLMVKPVKVSPPVPKSRGVLKGGVLAMAVVTALWFSPRFEPTETLSMPDVTEESPVIPEVKSDAMDNVIKGLEKLSVEIGEYVKQIPKRSGEQNGVCLPREENHHNNTVAFVSANSVHAIPSAILAPQSPLPAKAKHLVVSQLQPTYEEQTILDARTAVREGRIDDAIRQLESLPDQAKEQMEVVSLLAYLNQKQGQFAQSLENYRKLLTHEPDNGTWILGMAVSLDHLGRSMEALDVYRQAQGDRRLESGVQSFIQERIATLVGSPG
ncbi:MAG: hypothetical protein HQL94_00730 [Magnetococcales bacterium]|nr:hypothetical protein [Magnetococcales bacterium]MBF0438430.1 hypothetical protein [Magnetococcales bacterium]